MSSRRRGMAKPACGAALLLLCCLQGVLGATISCNVITDSTPMFGGPWKAGLSVTTHEQDWKQFGDITKVAVFYSDKAGCVQGVKTTHGTGNSARTVKLGIDSHDGNPLLAKELKLQGREVFQGLAYKAGKCVEHLRLTTNSGRSLDIGNAASTQPLQAGTTSLAGGFLAFLKGFTEIGPNKEQGPLQRLQLVWAIRDCAHASAQSAAAVVSSASQPGYKSAAFGESTERRAGPGGGRGAGASASAMAAASLPVVSQAPVAAVLPAPTVLPAPVAAPVRPAPCSPIACDNGTCPTSSCALNAMGKDVITMACFGTNIVPNPMLDMAFGNPCVNLACRLHRPNCTSMGLMGIGGYCTGKVVAMSATAKLHPVGKAFLGYPCIEHKGMLLDMIPLGDYTARGTYMAKAWKVCDCINGLDLAENSVAFDTSRFTGVDGGSLTIDVPKFSELFGNKTWLSSLLASGFTSQQFAAMPALQVLAAKLITLFPKTLPPGLEVIFDTPTVLMQWLAGLVSTQPLPRMTVEDELAAKLQAVLPGFVADQPCLLVFNASAPLFSQNTTASGVQGMPATVIVPDALARAVKELLPDITSVPTFLIPLALIKQKGHQLPAITLQDVTLPLVKQTVFEFASKTLPPGMASSLTSVVDLVAGTKMNFLAPMFSVNVSFPLINKLAQAASQLDSVVKQAAASSAVANGTALPSFSS